MNIVETMISKGHKVTDLVERFISGVTREVVVLYQGDNKGLFCRDFAAELNARRPFGVKYLGCHNIGVEMGYGTYYNIGFTLCNSKQEFEYYLKHGQLPPYEISFTTKPTKEEIIMPKRKQRKSNKVIITYSNGKSYTVKNLKCKPDVHKQTIVVNYIDNETVDGVKFKREVQVEIPTKDVLYFKVFPLATDRFVDTEFVFTEGKVVSKITHSKDCYGKNEFVNYGY